MKSNSAPAHLAAPEEVEISLTGRCNLECKYCFYADEMTARSDLSTSQWKGIIRGLGRARVLRAVLTGGEVFTRDDFFPILDSVIESRMRYTILTNGTLIDDELLEKFHKGKRMLRMDSIQVSIDGSCARVHDSSRPGSFRRALRGLKLLLEHGFPVTARVTISRKNIHDLQAIARLLLEDVGIVSFSTCDASPIGAGCTCEEEIALDHRDTLRAGLILEDLSNRYPGRITAQAGPLARLRMYREMDKARRTGEKNSAWKMGCLSSCGGVFSRIAILHDGSLVPCSMLHDEIMGNLLEEDLLTLWDNSPIIQQLRARRLVPLSSIARCSGCEWNGFCNGGCPGVSSQITGSLIDPDPMICYRDFLRENGLDSVPVAGEIS